MESQVGQIKQFLKEVYTRRHLFIIVAASVALIAVGASFFVPKRYEAQSTVFIERNVIDSLMKGMTVSPSMDDRIRVLRYYMVSRDMVLRTLKKMDMDADKRYAKSEQLEELIRKCQEQTNISVRGRDLFFVSITDPDPTFAKNYINTLVNIYVEENLAEKREESYGASRFLAEQVTFYKQKLDEIDAKILEFRKASGIYSTVNEPSIMAQIAMDEEMLKEVRGQKAQGYSTINTIKQQLKMLRETTAAGYSSSFSEADFGSGDDYRISQLQAKIDELLLVYNDQYPTVVKLRDQIEELKKRQVDSSTSVVNVAPDNYNPVEDPIYVDLKMRLNIAQSDLSALVAREQELQSRIEANQDMLRNFPKDKKTLIDLDRERTMQSDVYEQLMKRVGISDVSQQMEVADKSATFRIVDPAILPTEPVGIRRSILKLLGILGGLIVGLGAVFIAERLDSSLRGPQLLRELGVTVLAEIPFIWSDAETRVTRRKDKAALAFASICAVMIGVMLLHDLLGLSLIDQAIENLRINKV
jgi:polysaccharide chain length determinant protein (PEP-CTERM system associated)